jgi:copper chaperone CopZ
MSKLTIRIGGMTCDGCVRSITRVLGRVQGVRVDKVEVGSACVELDPPADEARVKEAIEKAGFTVVA